MEQVKIKLHSVTDLITNSSTVIYTYSNASAAACVRMINEILKALGHEKTCDEMFRVSVACDKGEFADYLIDHLDDIDNAPSELLKLKLQERRKAISVLVNKSERPEWLVAAELKFIEREDYNGYTPSTYLELSPISEEYTAAAKAIRDFLYSTSQEATRDG